MRTSAVTSLALLLAAVVPLRGQRVETGFLDRTVSVAGQSYRYQVYVPADYARQGRWPVILFLHGAGERGTDGLLQTDIGLGPGIRRAPGRFPAIVVFPQVPPDSQWVGTPADGALAAPFRFSSILIASGCATGITLSRLRARTRTPTGKATNSRRHTTLSSR